MGNRFWLWLGAGAVCAGVTVGMLAGAGTAFAQTGSEGADGGTTTSETSEAGDTQQDSVKKTTPSPRPAFGRNAVKAITAVTDAVTKTVTARDTEERATATASTRPRPGRRAAAFVNDVVAAVTQKPDRKVVTDRTRQTNPVDEPEPAANTVDASETPVRSIVTLRPPAPAQPNIATAAPRPQIDVPPVVSALGTAVFNLISFGEALIEGPPKALPGSGVTVERSTLKIGDQEVPADWYFPPTYNPDSATPPERIIYLQHGFLARGVFYDYTASYLAKETNSVVVAPTLTSNIFATDGMWLGGDQMHRAAADLFNDDNTALLESARAAGYTQNQLPANVILIGHSLGGGFAIDTARYMKRNQAQGLSTYYNLAGVVMLDGVSFTDPVAILEDPALDGVPIYNLSATPYPWNLFGTMDAALAQVRPGEFTGAQMLFGFHSDAMVGGNPLIQLGAYLLTGYGGPANVAGSQILAAGWINDLFNGNEASGFYGEPGDTITIPTPAGPAFGLVRPKQGPLTTALQDVTGVFFGLLAHINFATDVEPETADSCPAPVAGSSASCSTAIAA